MVEAGGPEGKETDLLDESILPSRPLTEDEWCIGLI